MSLREEQCKKVCRILDNVLANRPTERDSLIVAVRKAFAEPQERIKGHWIPTESKNLFRCSECDNVIYSETEYDRNEFHAFCGRCGADMRGMDRQAAIDVIRDYLVNNVDNEPMQKACQLAIKALSTEPQERTGYWQITDAYPHNVYCSECHKRFAQTHWAVWEDGSLPRKFCPNCGRKMEVSE